MERARIQESAPRVYRAHKKQGASELINDLRMRIMEPGTPQAWQDVVDWAMDWKTEQFK